MSDENVIKDIKESARNVKNSAKVAVVIKKWKNKSSKIINLVSYSLPTNKAKYFKASNKFINMKCEEKAKIASLFMYFRSAAAVHFKTAGMILLKLYRFSFYLFL